MLRSVGLDSAPVDSRSFTLFSSLVLLSDWLRSSAAAGGGDEAFRFGALSWPLSDSVAVLESVSRSGLRLWPFGALFFLG